MKNLKSPLLFGVAIVGVSAALFAFGGANRPIVADAATASAQAEDIAKKPAPVIMAKPGQSTATFAGGCFWSMDAIFNQVKGVATAQPGYEGGTSKNPTYEGVAQGDTGYAETINVIYDPKVISYKDLVDIFLTVHNPTQLNYQGNDTGTQYRSEIFYRNPQQKEIAEKAIAKPASAYGWDRAGKIVTQLAPYDKFYRAETYHLNYYNQHPNEGYCSAVVGPEIAHFKAKFADRLKK